MYAETPGGNVWLTLRGQIRREFYQLTLCPSSKIAKIATDFMTLKIYSPLYLLTWEAEKGDQLPPLKGERSWGNKKTKYMDTGAKAY